MNQQETLHAEMADAVRDFYEKHPYPLPVKELNGHRRKWQDECRQRADYHLFWPRRPYCKGLDILVAGCGTSQAARYALRNSEARIVGIDVSRRSIDETEKLIRQYNLTNLEVMQLPIEYVAELDLQFDKIVCTGVLIILTLLLLAPLFSYLPKAVLAAIIIDAVVFGMINVKEMRRLRHVVRADFWIAIAAILGVLGAGVLAGVTIGIALSVGWLVYVSAAPNMPELGRKPSTQVFRSIDEFPDGETYPGLLVLRFDAGLFFGSAYALEDRIRELALQADPPLHTVVIDFEGINFIDSQGSGKMTELVELATNYDIELRLTRVKPEVKALLRRDGVIDSLGESQIFGNVYEAAADQIPETRAPGDDAS